MASSWKIYGGTQNLVKFNNTYANDVVCNNLQVKNAYQGSLTINGSLDISGNFDISGDFSASHAQFDTVTVLSDLSANGDIYANGNLDVSENIIAKSLIYMGAPVINEYSPYIAGLANTTTGNLGINTRTPVATLDIRGGTDAILNVSSEQTTTRNILAQNSNAHGIALMTTDVSAEIQFYINNMIDSGLSPDANIRYGVSGELLIDVSNTVLQSKVAISTRPATSAILNESISIYDTDNTSYYANNYYDVSNIGHGATLIAQNNESMTYLHAITPDKKGTQWGGGIYPYDNTRNFGTWGYTDSTPTYVPAQTIVEGLSNIRSTTGINTYQPRVDDYTLDINGPVHICNNSLTVVKNIPFQVTSQDTRENISVFVGSPSTLSSLYEQQIGRSTTSGKTWTLSTVDDTLPLPITFNDVSIYDSSFSFVVGNNGYIYQSTDTNETWSSYPLPVDLSGNLLSVASTEDASGVFLMITRDNQPSLWIVHSVDDYSSNLDSIKSTKVRVIRDISNSTWSMYTLGYTSGTESNLVNYYTTNGTGMTLQSSFNGFLSATYNDICITDLSNVHVVGSNSPNAIILYTMDGGATWNSNETQEGILRSISTYSVGDGTVVGVAVGDDGLIMYSPNAIVMDASWNIVSNELLNGAGNAESLTQYDLTSVKIINLETILIMATVTTYSAGVRNGKSEEWYWYVPGLFNGTDVSVMDICGNGIVSGNWIVENNMAIGYSTPYTWDPSFVLNVNGIINGTLNVPSDYRIKFGVRELDEEMTIDRLCPYYYWNKKIERPEIGFLAHEVQNEYPYLVSGVKDGEHLQSVNYLGIIGLLVKEVKELKMRLNSKNM